MSQSPSDKPVITATDLESPQSSRARFHSMNSSHNSLEQSLLRLICRSIANPAKKAQDSHQQLSADFLIALSSFLASRSQFSIKHILPQVLNRFRKWRVLPRDERLASDVLKAVAKELAGLVHSLHPSPTRTMQIIWIPYSRTVTVDGHSSSRNTSEPVLLARPPSVPPHHEMAAFRSGCGACRMPRSVTGKQSKHHPSCAHSNSENIPPLAPADLCPTITLRPSLCDSSQRPETRRTRAATTASRSSLKPPSIPRRNTLSTKPSLSHSLSKPAALPIVRAVVPVPPAPISYPANKPRPWPLPEPSRKPYKASVARPRVALGRYNATGP